MKETIAMRCTQEQFESIEPKLIKQGFLIHPLDDWNKFPYLVNNFSDIFKNVSNLSNSNIGFKDRWNIHEIWNEKTFLEACGIEIEPTYILTKDQLKSLTDPQVKQWFPEVFKPVLEVGKWYKSHIGTIAFYSGKEEMCGFSYLGTWSNCVVTKYNFESCCEGVWNKATEEEVFEALKNEVIKRGLVDGVHYKHQGFDILRTIRGKEYRYHSDDNTLRINGFALFRNGSFECEIIPTITKEEAEKQLGKKIV